MLDSIDLATQPGQRIGVVGENGSGKSTLLRVLAGVEDHTGGTITRPSDLGYLPQDGSAPIEKIRDIAWQKADDAKSGASAATGCESDVGSFAIDLIGHDIAAVRKSALAPGLVALAEIAELGEQMTHIDEATSRLGSHIGEHFDALLRRADRDDLWNLELRADQVFAQMGLAVLAEDRHVATLSGGERSRLALAALLIRRPSALILDEPTNHLDDGALRFLTGELQRFEGVIVLASHDRVFLDDVCTDIVDLDPVRPDQVSGGARRYGGTFSQYLREREIERRNWEAQYASEQEELQHLVSSVSETSRKVGHDREMQDRNKMSFGLIGERVEGQISRRIRNARLRLDTLTRDQVAAPPAQLRLSLAPQRIDTVTPPRLSTATQRSTDAAPPTDASYQVAPQEAVPLLTATDVGVTGRLRPTNLTLQMGDHVLITGGNGTGKSTLLATLLGRLTPDTGAISRRSGIQMAILDQDITFPNPDATPRQIYATVAAVALETGAATNLPSPVDLGLLAARDLDRPVGHLSVGQRRRVALAIVLANPPDILLLDEPTNHLSPGLAGELEAALAASEMTVVIASHDRWLNSRWPATQYLVLSGLAEPSVMTP